MQMRIVEEGRSPYPLDLSLLEFADTGPESDPACRKEAYVLIGPASCRILAIELVMEGDLQVQPEDSYDYLDLFSAHGQTEPFEVVVMRGRTYGLFLAVMKEGEKVGSRNKTIRCLGGPPMEFMTTGPEENPRSSLLGTVVACCASFHMTALELVDRDGVQSRPEDSHDFDSLLLHASDQDENRPYQTVEIEGRRYGLFMSPYCV